MDLDEKYCRECGKEMVLRVRRKGYCTKCGQPKFKITPECPKRTSIWTFFRHRHTRVRSNPFSKIICPTCQPDFIRELNDEYPEQLPSRVLDLAIMNTDDSV